MRGAPSHTLSLFAIWRVIHHVVLIRGLLRMSLLSMNELTTYRWSLGQDLENYREAGYSGIGVWRNKVSDEDEADGMEQLTASGLSVTNVSWAGGFTGSDGRSLADSIEDAASAIRLA